MNRYPNFHSARRSRGKNELNLILSILTSSMKVTQSHLYQIKCSFLEYYNIPIFCGFLMNILGVIKGEKCQILFETPSTNFAKSYTKVKLIGHRCHKYKKLLLVTCAKYTGAKFMRIWSKSLQFHHFGSENTINCYRFGQKSESFKSPGIDENILVSWSKIVAEITEKLGFIGENFFKSRQSHICRDGVAWRHFQQVRAVDVTGNDWRQWRSFGCWWDQYLKWPLTLN